MIPKIIHQTYKNREVPVIWHKYQDKVRKLHPNWEYRLWTDQDNLAFVKQEYPDLLDRYVGMALPIMRADVIRYLIMDKIGGLYLDLDYEMIKPFDLTEHPLVLPYSRTVDDGADCDMVGNCIFASCPGHPFWKIVIEDIQKNPPPATVDVEVEASTGPIFLTRLFNGIDADELKIHTPRRMLFHPPNPRNKTQYTAIIDSGVSYGIHHCQGTWRTFTIKQRIRSKLSRLLRRFR